jgi:ornithine carbamoyltransferase
MEHLLTLKDLGADEILETVELAETVKRFPDSYHNALSRKVLAMIFQKTSTRTRMSFETGMAQMGGHAVYLDWRTTNLTVGHLRDEVRCMARYADAIVARVNQHDTLIQMVEHSDVPVVNALSDLYHPCQALGDLLTVKEKKGKLSGLKLAYVGDGNNVCNSLIIACSRVGMSISVATPPGYEPLQEAIEEGRESGLLELSTDPVKAVRGAQIVYTDTWVSLGQEEESDERLKVFPPYQVNRELLGKSRPLIMHCLPAHRGHEITDEIIDSRQSVVFDQAENRLHAQKALLLKLMK